MYHFFSKVSKPEDPLTLKEKKSSDELLSPHHAHSLPSKSQPLHTAPDSTMKAKYDLSIPPPLPPRPFQTSVSPPTSSAATTNHTFTDEKSTLLSRKARPSATAGESRNAATQQEVVSSSKGENKLDEVQADDAIGAYKTRYLRHHMCHSKHVGVVNGVIAMNILWIHINIIHDMLISLYNADVVCR